MNHSCLSYLRRTVPRLFQLRRQWVCVRYASKITDGTSPLPQALSSAHDDLFKYTSGRWVYNENQRFRERERAFDVAELQRLAAAAVTRKVEDIVSLCKLGEGAANRAFVVQFRDGFRLVARIPYLVTEPRQQVVASEAATLAFLRTKGIPVPEVYGYAASADNPAQTEYILLEFSPGRNLGTLWADMNEHHRLRFVESLVNLESRLFGLCLPASGSLYFLRDLPRAATKIAVNLDEAGSADSFYIGPSTSLPLWYGKRSELDVNRDPFTNAEAVMNAGAEKELQYLARYGRPLFPFNRMQRETFNLEKQQPSVHLDSLGKYLAVSGHLIPEERGLTQPVIRHPDLRPSNIFVSDDYEITSLIDWQHATALPLFLQSGIPDDLYNPFNAASNWPETPQLPDNLSALDEESRLEQLELFRERHLHHLYMTETANNNLPHYQALTLQFSTGLRKIYNLASAPWQGDNVPLRSSLIFIKQQWPNIVTRPTVPSCPIVFTEAEEQECLRLDDLEHKAAELLQDSMDMLRLGPEGWVASENYEAAKEMIARIKEMGLEEVETEAEMVAIRDHWIYDDMDEDEYL